MRIALTGGSGRIGQVTTRALLQAGYRVDILDRVPPPDDAEPGARFIEVLADDYSAVLSACRGADAIVHLAGIPSPEGVPPQEIHYNNVVASYNVLCAAVDLGIPRVLMASSVNAIGLTWSRAPTFDYFPIDEHHPTRNEDPYSLSKWLGEQQADSITRMHDGLSVGSFRIHMFLPDRAAALRESLGEHRERSRRGLWGYTTHRMWTDACVRALTAEFTGHQIFWVVSDRTAADAASADLARRSFPDVPVRAPLPGDRGFFDCGTTERLLGWSGADDD